MIRAVSRSGVASVTAAVAIVAALGVSGRPAQAHNAMVNSTPAPGAVLAHPPASVTVTFREPPDLAYAQLAVTGPTGAVVTTGVPRVSGTGLTVDVSLPEPGLYTVAYRVSSTDGHPVQGSHTFTLALARPTASEVAPAASRAPSGTGVPAAVARRSPNRPGVGWAIAAAGFATLAGAVLFALRRRKAAGQP